MDKYLPYIAMLISTSMFIISLLTYKRNKNIDNKQFCKDTCLSFNEKYNKMSNAIIRLNNQHQTLKIDVEILKERLSNEIVLLDKLEEKIDELNRELE